MQNANFLILEMINMLQVSKYQQIQNKENCGLDFEK